MTIMFRLSGHFYYSNGGIVDSLLIVTDPHIHKTIASKQWTSLRKYSPIKGALYS